METIFENKSLKFICNSINQGLVDYEKLENLEIQSKINSDIIIKIIGTKDINILLPIDI